MALANPTRKKTHAVRGMGREDRLALLRSLELLDALGDDALAALARAVCWIEVPAGEAIFRQGDAGDAMYFVAHGRLGILRYDDSSGDERIVRQVGPGQPVGELALLLDRPRSATATALRDSLLVRLDRAQFERLIGREPALLLPMSRRIAERLVTSTAPRDEGNATATLVVAALPSVDLAALWSEFSEHLGSHGARCMTSADLARACGSSKGIDSARAARWLEAQVRDGQSVFVVAEDTASILKLASDVDRTLLVADAEEAPGAGPLEDHFAALREQQVPALLDLVLLHRPDALPSRTREWLERVRPTGHHHLRRGQRSDLARLARRLTGQAIGLALGGGGARAFAHIGVIRALQESEIPIDIVAGTNIGAVVGAQLALGWEPDRMLAENRRDWPRVGRDLTLPFVSLLGGGQLRKLMQRMFGDERIEDVWLDFRCATIDLSWCRRVVHRDGPLERWVRASASVPGIHPPVVHAGRLYVDGALLESTPIELAREAGAGTVISVDPSPFRKHALDVRIEDAPSGLDFVLQRLPIVGTGFPSAVSLIHRALSVAQHLHPQTQPARSDLHIEPPVDRFGITDYSRVAEIAEFGYEETLRRLECDGAPVRG